MKRLYLFILIALCSIMVKAQSTSRSFVVPVSEDGKATLSCFLPSAEKATGRAVVVCPVEPTGLWLCSMKVPTGQSISISRE